MRPEDDALLAALRRPPSPWRRDPNGPDVPQDGAGSGARTRNPCKDGRAPAPPTHAPKEGAVSQSTLPRRGEQAAPASPWPLLPPPTWPVAPDRLRPDHPWHVWGERQHAVAAQARRGNLAVVELGYAVVLELEWERRWTAEDLDGDAPEPPERHRARLVGEWTRRQHAARPLLGDPLAALADYLDPPDPAALIEVEWPAAAAIVAEAYAARAVVAKARFVGREDLDDTDVAERLADAVDAYDQATQGRWPR